jgi:hypothetical protein
MMFRERSCRVNRLNPLPLVGRVREGGHRQSQLLFLLNAPSPSTRKRRAFHKGGGTLPALLIAGRAL